MIADLEARRGLDRTLEELPDQDGLAELARLGAGLTSPELATLQAHVKLDLKLSILDSELPELPVFAERLTSYFPPALTARYPDAVAVHPLRREIVTTLLVNEMVDCGGSTFAFRLAEDAGAGATDAPRAFRVVAEVFELPALWSEIAGLPAEVPSAATDRLVLATRGLLDAGTRWFLAHRSGSVAEELARFGPPVRRLIPRLPTLLRGREADGVRREAAELVELGVPAALADRVAGLRYAVGLLDVVEVGELADRGRARLPVEEVAELYYALSERRNYL